MPKFPRTLTVRCRPCPPNSTPARSRARVRRNRVIAAVVAVLVVALVIGLIFGLSSSKKSSTPKPPPVPTNRCPLTDLPAAGGKVPARPPLGVKIGNEPEGARPRAA